MADDRGEAEEHADGLLPLKDILQANTQLNQMAADQGVEHAPADSPTILVSDRLTVALNMLRCEPQRLPRIH